MVAALEKYHPLETGGILIGNYVNSNKVAIVEKIVCAPTDSNYRRNSFYRGTNGLTSAISEIRDKNRNLHYLGEWHTHPNYSPQASLTDVIQMNNFAKNAVFGSTTPILVIIGGTTSIGLQWGASVHRAWKRPVYLQQI